MLSIDRFIGLDRSRIRRVGFSELSHGLEDAIKVLAVQHLPALEQFAFIVLGPDPWLKEQAHTVGLGLHRRLFPESGLEMRVEDLLRNQCDVWSIDAVAVESKPFFNMQRLRYQQSLSPAIRPLPKYIVDVKALVWHALTGSLPLDLHSPAMIELRFEFLQYVLHGPSNIRCPLTREGSCTGAHGRDEMLDFQPDFELGFMLICERHWSPSAIKKGLISRP